MQIIQKPGYTELLADPGKLIVKVGTTSPGSTAMVLAVSDSPDNYEEIDELAEGLPAEPVEPEDPPYEIVPDPDGKIDYETAQRIMNDITALKQRTVELQADNNILTECLLEVSTLIYA